MLLMKGLEEEDKEAEEALALYPLRLYSADVMDLWKQSHKHLEAVLRLLERFLTWPFKDLVKHTLPTLLLFLTSWCSYCWMISTQEKGLNLWYY